MLFSEILNDYTEYKNLTESIEKNDVPISVSGIVESAHSQFIHALYERENKSALVVTYSDMEAKALSASLEFFSDKVLYFPSKEYVFYNIETSGHVNEHDRLGVLYKLCHTNAKYIIVTSIDALMQYTADRDVYIENSIQFELGKIFDIEQLSKNLTSMGYIREDMVEGIGQFSIRGGILDVYCPNMENPIRIEFFDDETDSIREFDSISQRSLDKRDSVIIVPCVEAIYDTDRKDKVIEALESSIKKLKRKRSDQTELISTIKADIENFNERHNFPSIDKYASLIYDEIPSLIDYIDDDLVFVIEPKRINERAKSFTWENGEIISELMEKGVVLGDNMKFFRDYSELAKVIDKKCMISINVLSHTSLDYKYKAIYNFTTKTTVSFHGKIDYLYDDLKSWKNNGSTVVILAANSGRGENLAGTLNDKGIKCRYINENADFQKGEIVVVRGDISKGFEYPDIGFVLVSDQEIFDVKRKRKRVKIDNANKLRSFNDISVGDYIVHQSHGIGQYVGMQKIEVSGITKDYLKIQYRGTDILYVPVDQLDLLYKYIGGTETKVKVNRLGGTDWSKTKAKVKASTTDMAKQLIRLYSIRENTKGYSFSEDTPWQRDFENTFIYQETEDQLRSIEEVKKDMENVKPMDRLLCGDVGYGKTEIAIRAAFKAATDGKQVAYLCPTTILAMQQFNNFCDRMMNFPIKVEMLSRFRTPAQQKDILKKLKTGEIDIIIGTHRILQKDLIFKDLGLLIVDEEQRFGVAHKEKLKELKQNIDVLTMTATPIPRTLHMAMVNIRDMSVLSEPPENRYPVQTYVLEQNESLLIDAIKKEVARGGQVFYLFNRVQGIYRVAEWIRSSIPDINVAVGHGKMKEDELEDIMYDMVNGQTDVLVCTTIIETGLDIPNANTIIIENADRMGLSQLYQLRGRVGRSNRAAYAYFTYQRDKSLSDVAQKRLRAIKEFTEFGSGFKIAMRDLEIRGAGDILGAQQHGHMDLVGYDMYCKILKESVDTQRGIIPVDDVVISIDLDVSAYIAENYIRNSNQRVDIYKKIAAVENEDDKYEIEDELIDRYGDIPKATQNLLDISYMKSLAKTAGIKEISQNELRVKLEFSMGQLDAKLVLDLSQRFAKKVWVFAGEKPCIGLKLENKKDTLKNITFLLQAVNELKKDEK